MKSRISRGLVGSVMAAVLLTTGWIVANASTDAAPAAAGRGASGIASGDSQLSRDPSSDARETTAVAMTRRASGDFQGAIQELEQAVTRDANDAGLLHALAAAYAQTAERSQATQSERRRLALQGVTHVERALAIDSGNFGALVTKSLLLRTLSSLATTRAQRSTLLQEANAVRQLALDAGRASAPSQLVSNPIEAPEPPPPPPPPPPPGGPADIIWTYGSSEYAVSGSTHILEKVKDVRPIYPPMMIVAGISGTVVLDAVIDPRGRVRDIRVVEAPPLLQQTTIDAVRQWQFDPEVAAAAPGAISLRVTATFPAAR